VVRIFNTYGPNMALDDGRVVSNFVAQARPMSFGNVANKRCGTRDFAGLAKQTF